MPLVLTQLVEESVHIEGNWNGTITPQQIYVGNYGISAVVRIRRGDNVITTSIGQRSPLILAKDLRISVSHHAERRTDRTSIVYHAPRSGYQIYRAGLLKNQRA